MLLKPEDNKKVRECAEESLQIICPLRGDIAKFKKALARFYRQYDFEDVEVEGSNFAGQCHMRISAVINQWLRMLQEVRPL